MPDARAKYPEAAAELRRLIAEGTWEPGAKLPAETALVTTLGVSLTVVRKAIAMLNAEGLLLSIHGSGTYVPKETDLATLAATGFEYVPPPLVIGQVVHYVTRGNGDAWTCRAALVTEIGHGRHHEDRVGLHVLIPNGMVYRPLSDDGGAALDHGAEGARRGARCGAGARIYAPRTWHRPAPVLR